MYSFIVTLSSESGAESDTLVTWLTSNDSSRIYSLNERREEASRDSKWFSSNSRRSRDESRESLTRLPDESRLLPSPIKFSAASINTFDFFESLLASYRLDRPTIDNCVEARLAKASSEPNSVPTRS